MHACLRRVSDTLHASLKSWSASSSAVKPDGTGGVAWVGSASSAPIVPLKWADQVLLRACRGKIEIPLPASLQIPWQRRRCRRRPGAK